MAWRRKVNQPFYRIVPLILTVAIFAFTFTVAGILSAKIGSATGEEVLLSSSGCGQLYQYANDSIDAQESTLLPYIAQSLSSSANYVQRCYSDFPDSVDCQPFIKRKLQRSINRNASCPFKKEICRHQDRNIKLDTGYINSHTDLGMNAPPSHRAAIRFIHHCAPLIMDGYKRPFNYSNDISYMRYYYGNQNNPRKDLNFTYEYEQLSIDQKRYEGSSCGLEDYTIG